MGNGQWVTPREFDAVSRRMDGLERKVDSISADVKALLRAHDREAGANEERRELLDATQDKGARRLAWGGIVMGMVGALWWVQDAVARLGH